MWAVTFPPSRRSPSPPSKPPLTVAAIHAAHNPTLQFAVIEAELQGILAHQLTHLPRRQEPIVPNAPSVTERVIPVSHLRLELSIYDTASRVISIVAPSGQWVTRPNPTYIAPNGFRSMALRAAQTLCQLTPGLKVEMFEIPKRISGSQRSFSLRFTWRDPNA